MKMSNLLLSSDWDLSVCLHYECLRKQLQKPNALTSWIDLRATYRVSFNTQAWQGSNLGGKFTRPQGVLLKMFTGPNLFLQDQNQDGKKTPSFLFEQVLKDM